ncbi:MAG: AMP-binding protein [Hyphomicrobiales bacterium]
MSSRGGQVDRFVHDRLPPIEEWPEIVPLDCVPQKGPLNCVSFLLERHTQDAMADRVAFHGEQGALSYGDLNDEVCRTANALAEDFGIISGNRVLIRSANRPEVAVLWLAIQKIGAIPVTTMSLLREAELAAILAISQPKLAFCEESLSCELKSAIKLASTSCVAVTLDDLSAKAATYPPEFTACKTNADDIALVGFTSGTTGKPKATIHFHRDVLTICKTLCRHIITPQPVDIFIGTSPLAFTFGLGGLMLFPLYAGASSILLPRYTPEQLLSAIGEYGATVCFTVPTFYQQMARLAGNAQTRSLRLAVSSGEALPMPVGEEWRQKTSLSLTEVLGSTELLHAFIGSTGAEIRKGFIGTPLPGYEAIILGDDGAQLEPGELGRLAVKGPTGCRYLDDERQIDYVQNGWNITGDVCSIDADGYVAYHARSDDMIISAGYNISAAEVENALLTHEDVSECAVIAAPDVERGHIVAAYIVPKNRRDDVQAFATELQAHVRAEIAPYKYPRHIEFTDKIPRNESGKIQRFKLRN